jgi:hypothetical protein
MFLVCPVCGAKDGACGEQALVLAPLTLTREPVKEAGMAERKIYLPAQRSVRGKPGYLGSNIVIVGSAEDDRGSSEPAVVSLEKGPAAKAAAKPKAK